MGTSIRGTYPAAITSILALCLTCTGCSCGRISIEGETDASADHDGEPEIDAPMEIPEVPEEPLSDCGNGRVDEDELCDGTDLAGATCESLGYYSGSLTCKRDCTYDESRCGDLPECVRYVDIDSVSESPDGLTWETAFTSVTEGISAAAEAASTWTPCEVWIAEGTYYIYVDSGEDTVLLHQYVHVFGGFGGWEELRVERNYFENETIIDGHEWAGSDNRVYHVVTGNDNCTINGLTITGGRTIEEYPMPVSHMLGAGMYNRLASPTIANCIFKENHAQSGHNSQGGAIYNVGRSSPTIKNCQFLSNTAEGFGGAIVNVEDSRPIIENCYFEGNSADTGGAITSYYDSAPTITNCIFVENRAFDSGGAVAGGSETSVISNSIFFRNTSDETGGALYFNIGTPLVVNSVFQKNSAVDGGGVLHSTGGAYIHIANSVVWDNEPDLAVLSTGGTYEVFYSDIEGGHIGPGNIDGDPRFISPPIGDFHLQAGSPCIDSANGELAPTLDADGYPRVDDPSMPNTGVGDADYVDMGAYEYRP